MIKGYLTLIDYQQAHEKPGNNWLVCKLLPSIHPAGFCHVQNVRPGLKNFIKHWLKTNQL